MILWNARENTAKKGIHQPGKSLNRTAPFPDLHYTKPERHYSYEVYGYFHTGFGHIESALHDDGKDIAVSNSKNKVQAFLEEITEIIADDPKNGYQETD
jgi:hypothetical protein